MLQKVYDVYANKGFGAVLSKGSRKLYNQYLRGLLPKSEEYACKNGIKVSRRRWLDTQVPWSVPPVGNPDHEKVYVEMIREYVEEDQTVAVVGGGWGVSTVVAAQIVGPGGEVVCYEGSERMSERTERTVALNNVADWTTVEHAIVANDVRLGGSGNAGSASVVPADELPASDVLLIDCDGCEMSLMGDTQFDADTIIVEHHAVKDGAQSVTYQPDEMQRLIEAAGYNIVATNSGSIDEAAQFGNEETVFVGRRTSE